MKGFLVLLLLLLCSLTQLAGPPFVTDDPEPVEYQHWEFYIASQHVETSDGWSGTAPHVELNYGAISNLQLSPVDAQFHQPPLAAESEFSLRFSPSFSRVMPMSFSWNQQEQSDAASCSEGGTVIKYRRVSDLIPKQPGNNARD